MRAAARLNREVAAAGREVDLCLVGDSLTAGWRFAGEAAFAVSFHGLKTLNLGLSGDRTEHMLHRLGRCDLRLAEPRLFVLLAGTNNLSKDPPDTPEAVAHGVVAVARALKGKSPASAVLIVSILPNGTDPDSALRRSVVETNALLAERAAAAGFRFLDVHDRFLDGGGRWRPGLSTDGTHLSGRGYDVLATPISGVVAELGISGGGR